MIGSKATKTRATTTTISCYLLSCHVKETHSLSSYLSRSFSCLVSFPIIYFVLESRGQVLTSSWVPCCSSPSTVHLMMEGGLDSWLEQTKLMSPPIWALSGPLMWTLSPETKNTPINLQLQSNLAGKPSNLHFSLPCITFFLPSEKWNNSLCKTSHLKWREIYQVLNKLQHKQQSEISLHRIFACMEPTLLP